MIFLRQSFFCIRDAETVACCDVFLCLPAIFHIHNCIIHRNKKDERTSEGWRERERQRERETPQSEQYTNTISEVIHCMHKMEVKLFRHNNKYTIICLKWISYGLHK